jgi:hypothetical protein
VIQRANFNPEIIIFCAAKACHTLYHVLFYKL